jgi:hypothetical protein
MKMVDADDLDLSSITVKWLRRQCELETTNWAATTVRCPVDLHVFLGAESGAEITSAILRILQKRKMDQYTTINFHLVRPDQQSKSRDYATVQDVVSHEDTDVICVLFAATGDGFVRFLNVHSGVNGGLNRVELLGSKCALYSCQTPYSLNTKASYVHAKCSLSKKPYAPIYNVMRYACPYANSATIGEIPAYHKKYQPHPNPMCNYSTRTWKNVLDHLVFCKFNPDIDACRAKQTKRHLQKQVNVQCKFCGRTFTNTNALSQHNLRRHRRK